MYQEPLRYCPKCGETMHKDGLVFSGNKKVQRWRCRNKDKTHTSTVPILQHSLAKKGG